MFRVLVFICTLLLCKSLLAQEDSYQFSHLDISNGLSDNQVNAIYKDRKGFMWFGTMAGLNRYDGHEFKVFKHDSRDSTSISDDYINSIFEGPDKKIWIYNSAGINIYDPSAEKFERFQDKHFARYKIPGGYLRNIKTDNKGKYYFHIDRQGIFCYDKKSNTTTKYAPKKGVANSLSSHSIADFVVDNKGNLWVIYTDGVLDKFNLRQQKVTNRYFEVNKRFKYEDYYSLRHDSKGNVFIFSTAVPFGLYYLNAANNTFKYFGTKPDHSGLSSNNVSSVIEGGDGNIWIGTDHGGINILDLQTFKFKYIFAKEDDPRGLKQNSIGALYCDDNGIVWVGTMKKGVSYYHKSIFTFPRNQYLTGKNVVYKDVNTFAEDRSGNLWIGTNGSGLLYLNRSTGEIKVFRNDPSNANSISSDIIVSLCIDHRGVLWIGTYLGGLNSFDGKTFTRYRHSSDPSSLADDRVYAVLEDDFKRLWVGTLSGGLNLLERPGKSFRRFNPSVKNTLNSYVVTTLAKDRNRNVWIGTTNGVSVLSPNGKFTYYLSDSRDTNSLVHSSINSILEDSRGWVWIGTREGISIFNPKTKVFRSLTNRVGLPENYVFEIAEDEFHNIWYSSRNGLYKITIEASGKEYRLRYNSYDESDGLQSRQLNLNAVCKTKANELIFGGANGFNIFKPAQIKHVQRPSLLAMTGLEMYNHNIEVGERVGNHIILPKSITELDELILTHKENIFSLKFGLLNYFNNRKIVYKYNLEGFDKRWLTVTSEMRKATFTNLDPGEYTFHVKAFNENSPVVVGETQLKIIILPPFWRTTWAYVLYTLTALLLLLTIRNRGIKKLKQEFALEQERIQSRQLREMEQKEAERLRELDLLKIKFLTNLSHEFRTPISLILAPVEKLLNESGDKTRNGQLSMIRRNARRLLNLVNQLLDFRKMEEQELKLNVSEGDIVSFIKDATDSFFDLAERKQIRLSFKSSIENLLVLFDHDKIERILFNLLSNAFKFTPSGGSVSVELQSLPPQREDGRVSLELKVSDSGIGIPEDKHEKIFESFFQNETSPTILNQGSGIGLSITKEFVKMHGGEISVESKQGSGTCFTVRLELVASVNSKQENMESSGETEFPTFKEEDDLFDETHTSDKRIRKRNAPVVLLVEDNEDFRFYLKDNLKLSYKIIEASNGKEGWQKALALHPHLVVSDISMPEMNGIELCEKLKSDRRTRHIPVILLTALTAEDDQLKGLETGANDYMTKPFNFEILHSKIKNLLTLHQTFKKTYTKQINLQAPEMEIESDDLKFINKVLLYIEKNLNNEQLSVEDLSKHIGMSRVSLYKKCLNVTGVTPVDYIRSVKLEKAAVLLEKSNKTVAEICYMTGFGTPNYFSKLFKAKYNMLPSEYLAAKRNSK